MNESAKVHLKVITDVPYFVEDNASCPVEEEEAAVAETDDVEIAEIKPSEEEDWWPIHSLKQK